MASSSSLQSPRCPPPFCRTCLRLFLATGTNPQTGTDTNHWRQGSTTKTKQGRTSGNRIERTGSKNECTGQSKENGVQGGNSGLDVGGNGEEEGSKGSGKKDSGAKREDTDEEEIELEVNSG